VRAQILLQIQERNLNVGGRLEKISELLIENQNATVVGVLETLVLDVLVDRLGYGATRNGGTLGKLEKSAKLIGDLLLTVKTVVLSAVSRLFTVRVVLLCLDLTDNLTQRLDVRAESGKFGLNSFKRHYILGTFFIFKYVLPGDAVIIKMSIYSNGWETLF
jgi:hypothetical protein